MELKTGGAVYTHYAALFIKESRPMWMMMMDDNASRHKRRKLFKNLKNVLSRIWTVVAEVCGETYSKTDDEEKEQKNSLTSTSKRATDLKKITLQINGQLSVNMTLALV